MYFANSAVESNRLPPVKPRFTNEPTKLILLPFLTLRRLRRAFMNDPFQRSTLSQHFAHWSKTLSHKTV